MTRLFSCTAQKYLMKAHDHDNSSHLLKIAALSKSLRNIHCLVEIYVKFSYTSLTSILLFPLASIREHISMVRSVLNIGVNKNGSSRRNLFGVDTTQNNWCQDSSPYWRNWLMESRATMSPRKIEIFMSFSWSIQLLRF